MTHREFMKIANKIAKEHVRQWVKEMMARRNAVVLTFAMLSWKAATKQSSLSLDPKR